MLYFISHSVDRRPVSIIISIFSYMIGGPGKKNFTYPESQLKRLEMATLTYWNMHMK